MKRLLLLVTVVVGSLGFTALPASADASHGCEKDMTCGWIPKEGECNASISSCPPPFKEVCTSGGGVYHCRQVGWND